MAGSVKSSILGGVCFLVLEKPPGPCTDGRMHLPWCGSQGEGAKQIRACLDDVVLENYSITILWLYKPKRHKTVV